MIVATHAGPVDEPPQWAVDQAMANYAEYAARYGWRPWDDSMLNCQEVRPSEVAVGWYVVDP